MGFDLVESVRIDEITGGRRAAIEHWLRAYDAFHEATSAAAAASIGGAIGLPIAYGRNDEDALTRAFLASGMVDVHEGRNVVKVAARDRFEALITKEVDRRCWSHLMKSLGFDRLLDAQARTEFEASLRTDPAPFTSEACSATFGNIWENRRELYLRGIATVFAKLDRRFRSHDGFKIGARLIIESALSDGGSYWSRYERRDALHDVERVFLEMDGKPPVNWDGGIAGRITSERRGRATPFVIEGDYFRVRVFGNGNLHLWFERKDLLLKVNRLLAEYYGEAIGEGSDVADVADMGPGYHVTPARDFGLFESPADVVAHVFGRLELSSLEGKRVLEPSAGRGRLANEARRLGGNVQCVEIQHGLCAELARAGHKVREGDFLQMSPDELGLFDVIVMNPPFDRGRDCDHVRHALQFLKPGGRLVSVMSASAEHAETKRAASFRALVEKLEPIRGWRSPFWDLPDGSFRSEGTNVNTMTCAVINRPRR